LSYSYSSHLSLPLMSLLPSCLSLSFSVPLYQTFFTKSFSVSSLLLPLFYISPFFL
jgi:hypothetical protein